jgi:PIN domain nuclease of toxin-antitoxin system
MSGYLLDTHTAIWFYNGNDNTGEAASVHGAELHLREI